MFYKIKFLPRIRPGAKKEITMVASTLGASVEMAKPPLVAYTKSYKVCASVRQGA